MKSLRWASLGLRFFAIFAWQIVRANWALARTILFTPNDQLDPHFVRYDVRGLSRWERLWLSHAITLTPGTTSVDIDEQGATLILHVIDVRDVSALQHDIDQGLRDPLLAWLRAREGTA
jgi:multisubunit Na+/H+ antiporter MnhE subunit